MAFIYLYYYLIPILFLIQFICILESQVVECSMGSFYTICPVDWREISMKQSLCIFWVLFYIFDLYLLPQAPHIYEAKFVPVYMHSSTPHICNMPHQRQYLKRKQSVCLITFSKYRADMGHLLHIVNRGHLWKSRVKNKAH